MIIGISSVRCAVLSLVGIHSTIVLCALSQCAPSPLTVPIPAGPSRKRILSTHAVSRGLLHMVLQSLSAQSLVPSQAHCAFTSTSLSKLAHGAPLCPACRKDCFQVRCAFLQLVCTHDSCVLLAYLSSAQALFDLTPMPYNKNVCNLGISSQRGTFRIYLLPTLLVLLFVLAHC